MNVDVSNASGFSANIAVSPAGSFTTSVQYTINGTTNTATIDSAGNVSVQFGAIQPANTIMTVVVTLFDSTEYWIPVSPAPETVTISGGTKTVSTYAPCWQYQDAQTCYSSTYSGNCDAIAATNGCGETGSTCAATDPDGVCHTYDNTYTCGAELGTVPSGVTTLPVSYTVTQTPYDQCTSLESNPSCTPSGQTCVDGPSTKVINGDSVYESCWQYQNNYTCVSNSTVNDCQTLQSQPQCKYQSQQCISTNNAGTCMQWQDSYDCSTSGTAPSQISCGGRVYCINGECDTASYAPNQDFAKAATWLNLAQGMGSNIDPNTLQIFGGSAESCGIAVLNVSNCCSDNGWGLDVGLANCSAEEKQLATDIQNKLTHYVGTYCAEKDPIFGICLLEKKSYCKFPSLLGKILQEQGRPQIGKGWGSASSPDCSGFTVAQLQSLDFSKIDLSQFYPQLYQQVSVPGQGSVTSDITQRIQNYYDQTQ